MMSDPKIKHTKLDLSGTERYATPLASEINHPAGEYRLALVIQIHTHPAQIEGPYRSLVRPSQLGTPRRPDLFLSGHIHLSTASRPRVKRVKRLPIAARGLRYEGPVVLRL